MKIFKFLFAILTVALLLGGCKYDFIVPEEVPIIDPEDPNAEQISFSTAIVPIFSAKCTSCHTTGKQLPDLSANKAFSSLNSTRYINSGTPAESKIYTRPHPDNTDTHPKYSAVEAALILGWIQQGAKNN
jgi:hypothetical protein